MEEKFFFAVEEENEEEIRQMILDDLPSYSLLLEALTLSISLGLENSFDAILRYGDIQPSEIYEIVCIFIDEDDIIAIEFLFSCYFFLETYSGLRDYLVRAIEKNSPKVLHLMKSKIHSSIDFLSSERIVFASFSLQLPNRYEVITEILSLFEIQSETIDEILEKNIHTIAYDIFLQLIPFSKNLDFLSYEHLPLIFQIFYQDYRNFPTIVENGILYEYFFQPIRWKQILRGEKSISSSLLEYLPREKQISAIHHLLKLMRTNETSQTIENYFSDLIHTDEEERRKENYLL